MNNRKIRTCSVCRDEYEFCPVCNPKDRNKPTFYFAYCSEKCKTIYDVMSRYEHGEIDAQSADEWLSKLDLSKKENFGESYKNTLKKIADELKQNEDVVVETTKEESVEETESVEDVGAGSADNTVKSFRNSSKKRGNKSVE